MALHFLATEAASIDKLIGAAEWSKTTAYEVGDYVQYDEGIYVSIKDGTNKKPGDTGSEDYWKQITIDGIQKQVYQLFGDFSQDILTAEEYDDSKAYSAGDVVEVDGQYWTAIEDVAAGYSPEAETGLWAHLTLDALLNEMMVDVILFDDYDASKDYKLGDAVKVGLRAYYAKKDVAAGDHGSPTEDTDNWIASTKATDMVFDVVRLGGAPFYDASTGLYDTGDYVVHDGKLYVNLTDTIVSGTWNESKWTEVTMSSTDAATLSLKEILLNALGSGIYDNSKTYKVNDVVVAPDDNDPYNPGALKAFRALKDNPGDCPGDDWTETSLESVEKTLENIVGELFDFTKAYQKGDTVSYKGKTYVALQDNGGNEPDLPASAPYWKEITLGVIEDEIDGIRGGIDEFNITSDYEVGDYVVKDGDIYRAKEDIAAGAWNATKWDKVDIKELSTVLDNITAYDQTPDWDATSTYLKDSVVDDDNNFYICMAPVDTATTTHPADDIYHYDEDTETWVGHWKQINIGQLAKDKLDNPLTERLEGNVLTISKVDATGNIEYKWMPVSEIPTQGTSTEVAGGTIYDKEKMDYVKGNMIVYVDPDTRASKAYYCIKDYPDGQTTEIVPGTTEGNEYWKYESFASLQGDIAAAASGLTPSVTGGAAWVTTQGYEFGDVVTYGEGDDSKAYVAIKDDATGGHTPGATGSEAYWKEINFKTLNKDKANLVDIAGNGAEDWEAKTSPAKYAIGTPVIKDGKIYICIKEATNQEPATAGGADYWKELNLSDLQTEKADLEKVSGASIEDDEWEAKAYDAGDYVLYEGALYRASEDVTATDIPGTSNKWVAITLKGLNNLHDVIFKDADLTADDKSGTYFVVDEANDIELLINRDYLKTGDIEMYFDKALDREYYASRVIVVDSDTPYAAKDFVRDNSTMIDVLPNGTDFDTVGAWKDSFGEFYDCPLFLGKWFIPYDTTNYTYTNLPDVMKYMDGTTEKYYPSYIETSCGNVANEQAQTLTVVTPDGLKIYTRRLDKGESGTYTTEWVLVGSNDIDIEGVVDTTDKKIVTFTHDELKSTSTNDYMVSFYVNNDELSIKSKSVNGTTGVLTVTFNKELGDDDEVTAHLIKKN